MMGNIISASLIIGAFLVGFCFFKMLGWMTGIKTDMLPRLDAYEYFTVPYRKIKKAFVLYSIGLVLFTVAIVLILVKFNSL